jgi:hypothetical protein
MNFVNQLEDYLRDLGAEARKKHPGRSCASDETGAYCGMVVRVVVAANTRLVVVFFILRF